MSRHIRLYITIGFAATLGMILMSGCSKPEPTDGTYKPTVPGSASGPQVGSNDAPTGSNAIRGVDR